MWGASRERISLLLLGVAALALGACRGRGDTTLTVAFLPNLTHAVPLVERARGSLSVDGRPARFVAFHDGPTAVEALLAGDVDVVYCGPAPAVNAFVRGHGRVRVLAGAASGGASFVVQRGARLRSAADLRGTRLATPQIGNSQDVALRSWLWQHDLLTSDRGGDVTVVPLSNADIEALFRAEEIDGAWVPEPWASRLILDDGGREMIDERTLWPGGRFPATLVLVRDAMVRERPDLVRELARTNRETIAWIARNPAAARKIVNDALLELAGQRLSPSVLDAAWKRLEFTDDAMLPQLKEIARAEKRIGYLPESDLRGLVVTPDEYRARKAAP